MSWNSQGLQVLLMSEVSVTNFGVIFVENIKSNVIFLKEELKPLIALDKLIKFSTCTMYLSFSQSAGQLKVVCHL